MLTRLNLALAWTAALLFVATGVMLTWEVAARYFFTAPTIWAAELSQLCLIWGVLLALPWALEARRHIAVDAVAVLLPAPVRRVVETVAMLAVAAFSAVIVWHGGQIALTSLTRGRTSGSMLDMPLWINEAPVPIGFALLFAQALVSAARAWRGEWDGGADHPEAGH